MSMIRAAVRTHPITAAWLFLSLAVILFVAATGG